MTKMKRRRLQPRDYTVGWICALPLELQAATKILDEEHDDLPQEANHPNLYTLGRISGHNVVIVCLPAGYIGTNSAAATISQMKSKFPSIQYNLMVGIGGGVPCAETDIRLGDVVVSQPHLGRSGVVQYDFGKSMPGGFERTSFLNAPPTLLLSALSKLQADNRKLRSQLSLSLSAFNCERNQAGPDLLFESTYNHVGGPECDGCNKERLVPRMTQDSHEITIHYGTIASGNQVIRDGVTRDKISSELGGVLCFEMEAAGLMNNFPCLVIRGISDYADSHKNNKWQSYAAATAAAYAREVLSVIPVTEITATCPVGDAGIFEILQPSIDGVNLNQFLPMLSALDQAEHISRIPPLDCDNPIFFWIFRNMDFTQWNSTKCSRVLWLSGPSECDIHQVSSYIMGHEMNTVKTEHFVLYFFFSAAVSRKSIVTEFIHTLLNQMIDCSPPDKRILVIRRFLHSLLDDLKIDTGDNWRGRNFSKKDSSDTNIRKLLDAPASELLAALSAVLSDEQRSLSVIVDGLDKVEHERSDFIKGIRAFVDYLQHRTSKMKILLTSRPQTDIKEVFDGLLCIEYDKERKGLLAPPYLDNKMNLPLHTEECLSSLRFDNERFRKISKEYKGSCEWLWAHPQYKEWSTSDCSRLLLIEGKPGSGKSTLTKYFNDNLLEREPAAKSAIVAKFFYSYREGELQRSHYNMLRTILYDVLDQDEAFFYGCFQAEYRVQRYCELRADWDYTSLKKVLRSLQDYSPAKKIYLVIDAVDESEDNDRSNILNLLVELCAEMKYCITKIFIASRPVGQIELRRGKFNNFIRLQDETKDDISSYAHSLLECLNLSHVLVQATEYIVENAQGVFLWVRLVGEELLTRVEEGDSEAEIFDLLQRLPIELKDFYKLMFERMNKDTRNRPYAVKIFRFVLSTQRPLTVDELRHALIIPDNPDDKFTLPNESFHKHIPPKQRIIHCGGNFLEIKPHHDIGVTQPNSGDSQTDKATVQVMHQTVREFFLDPNGCVASSNFDVSDRIAHVCISTTCTRYLMLFAANIMAAGMLPRIDIWTLEHFNRYAQYLDEMPLANYALRYLRHHIDSSREDTNILGITSQLIDGLTRNPALYFLENWVRSHLNKTPLSNEQSGAAQDFRNKVLHAAVRKRFPIAAEMSVTVGADVNARDKEGLTPLSRAAEKGHEAVVKVLLDARKVNADWKDPLGRTPLSRAAGRGQEAVVKLLLETGKVNADSKDNHGRMPLSWAAERGHKAVVKVLLETGKVDADSKDDHGRTPLSWAAERGHKAVVKLLLGMGKVDSNGEDCHGRTPLSWAAERGHEAVVKVLLETGEVYADSEDNHGRTPLSWAAETGHEAVVKALLKKEKVNVDSKDRLYGLTPLSRAAATGHEAVVKVLLEMGSVDADFKGRLYGRTPLSWAAEGGHEAVVKVLLEAGKVNADSKDNHGRTPLSWAAERGHEAVTKLLLETGKVDADSKDYQRRTPLSWAAERGHEAVVKLLLETGKADTASRDNHEMTPLSRAIERGHGAVSRLLCGGEESRLLTDIATVGNGGRTP